MNREDTVRTTRRVLDLLDRNTLDCAPDPRQLPSSVFIERERFLEDQALMARSPHAIAYAGEIQRGHYRTRSVAGIPVLLVRDNDGRLRAFLNACAHRGACVAKGAGKAQRFKCSYHAWCYDQKGRLVARPGSEHFGGIDEAGLGLKPLPLAEERGLVVVGLQEGVEVEGHLDSVAHALEYRYEDYEHLKTWEFTVEANWKLVVDVNFEGYHFPFLHKNSLHPIALGNASFDLFDRHGRWAFPLRSISRLRELPEEAWPDCFEGTVVYFLFPSCVLVQGSTASQMIRVYPGSHPGQAQVQFSYMLNGPATEEEREGHLQGAQFAIELLRGEDFVAAAECQQGFEAGRDSLVLGRNEPLLQHIHRVWDEAVVPQRTDQRST
jgi:phenylpropionate dioxygenase-like ring-hydroxylating dioxygenase large terminal subunit